MNHRGILAIVLQPNAPSYVDGGAESDIAPKYLYDSRRFKWDGSSTLSELTRHQLPPTIQLSVIAVDEVTWNKLPVDRVDSMAQRLKSMLKDTLFQNTDDFQRDQLTLAEFLKEYRVEHRVFTTEVPLRAARWSASLPQ